MGAKTLCKMIAAYMLFLAALNAMPASWGYAAGVWTRGVVSAALGQATP